MKHLKTLYTTELAKDYVNGAIVVSVLNKNTKKKFVIAVYDSLAKAKELGQNAINTMLKHTHGIFHDFVNEVI